MDYKEKYEQAINFIKDLYPHTSDYVKEKLDDFFPELKESEDERIRKAIHIYLDWLDGHKDYQPKGNYTIKDMIAWLEKQGQTYTKRDVDDAWLKGMCDAKRELEKQDEQKTAEKIEPFDKYEGLTDFERTLADICIGWIGEEFGWKQYIKDNADVLLKIAVEKFNSVQDVPFEQNPATSYCQEHCKGYQETGKCFADGDCRDKREAERKSTWSEEGENKNYLLSDFFKAEYERGKADVLKSIAWSDEDEDLLFWTINNLTELKNRYGKNYGKSGKCIDWLKSLKQRIGG